MPISRQGGKILRWQSKILKNCCCGESVTGNYTLFLGLGWRVIIHDPQIPYATDTTLITEGPEPFPVNQTNLYNSCITASYTGNTPQNFKATRITGQQFRADGSYYEGFWCVNLTNKTIYMKVHYKRLYAPPGWPGPDERDDMYIIPLGSYWFDWGTPSSELNWCRGVAMRSPAFFPVMHEFNISISFTDPGGP